MAVTLKVNRKRIQRLMRILGIEALYPKPNLSRLESTGRFHARNKRTRVRLSLKPAEREEFIAFLKTL